MASFVVRTLADLGSGLSFAPERHRASSIGPAGGVALGDLVVLRNERLAAGDTDAAIVLDTTHAKDGLLDLASAQRSASPLSAKKVARPGDLLVSRLRPYLRQVAFVHPAALGHLPRARPAPSAPPAPPVLIACSTEYYVLAPREGERLEYLLPFLLGASAQAVLAAGQEGGHHPRVPLETLLSLRVPRGVLRGRARTSPRVHEALAEMYRAMGRVQELLLR